MRVAPRRRKPPFSPNTRRGDGPVFINSARFRANPPPLTQPSSSTTKAVSVFSTALYQSSTSNRMNLLQNPQVYPLTSIKKWNHPPGSSVASARTQLHHLPQTLHQPASHEWYVSASQICWPASAHGNTCKEGLFDHLGVRYIIGNIGLSACHGNTRKEDLHHLHRRSVLDVHPCHEVLYPSAT